MTHPRPRLRAGAAVVGLATAAVVAGCGTPAYHYATNTDDGVYFKVPAAWSRVDQHELDDLATAGLDAQAAAALRASSWSVAFDTEDPPSARHIVSLDVTSPLAYARVLQVPEGSRSGVTVDALRDVFVPVTKSARTKAVASGSTLGTFALRSTETNAPKGYTGVHQVFSYARAGSNQVFDQTSWANRDHSRIYLLLVRCNDACYSQHEDELAAVVKSFTVDKNGSS
jgi:hypothetical protein